MNAKANTAAVEDDIKLLLDTLWNSHLKSSMKIKKSSVMVSIKFWLLGSTLFPHLKMIDLSHVAET